MSIVEREMKEQSEDLVKVYRYIKNLDAGEFKKLLESDIVYFIGCGSSYYIGISASKYFTEKSGVESKALPAGEVLFATGGNISNRLKRSAVLISRSGETSEVVLTAKKIRDLGVPTIGITLQEGSSLEKSVDIPVVLPIEEKAIVMTKSFTSMLLSLQVISDRILGEDASKYEKLLKMVPGIYESSHEYIEKEKLHKGSHYVFLGVGAYEGIARESALKLEEMSLSKTEAYSTFEYRHGPKSLAGEGVVVTIFKGGDRSKVEEEKLKRELESYGARVVLREKLSDGAEDVFLSVIFSQVLALKIAQRKGIDVDSPRNLTKVVKLY
jgi:glucosamine--fructose-6-phosphate aminotransferase (isomerizing)